MSDKKSGGAFVDMAAIGQRVAEAMRLGDLVALESVALRAGRYSVLMEAARRAGVDTDELEEMLARI